MLRIAPAPAAALQEAVLTDLNGQTLPFMDGQPTLVQCLLRHAMAEVISDGMINSFVVTNSVEANLEFVRMHERLFARTFPSCYPLERRKRSPDVFSPPNLLR